MRGLTGLAVAVLALPVCGWAQVYTVPAGCEAIVTVQSRSCLVRQVMRCADNPDGATIALVRQEGEDVLLRQDAGSQTIEAVSVGTGEVVRTVVVTDPIDARLAAKTGHDGFDLEQDGGPGPRERFAGEMVSDGAPVIIDGVLLVPLAAETVITTIKTGETRTLRQTLLFEPRERIAYVATTQMTDPPGALLDRTPVSFILPGEAGFLSMEPDYDCDP